MVNLISMNETNTRLTWRKGKNYSGMMRLPATYSLYRNGKELATVQEIGEHWFWYCNGNNTASKPTDLKTAKKKCKSYYLSI